jgi:hypothetical protein
MSKPASRRYLPPRFLMRHVVNPIMLRSGADRARSAVRPPDQHTPSHTGLRRRQTPGLRRKHPLGPKPAGRRSAAKLRWGRTRETFLAAEVHGTEHDRVVQAYHEPMGWPAR